MQPDLSERRKQRTMATLSAEAKETIGKGGRARAEAVRRLVAAHQEEFDGILNGLRAEAGLPPVGGFRLTPEEIQLVLRRG